MLIAWRTGKLKRLSLLAKPAPLVFRSPYQIYRCYNKTRCVFDRINSHFNFDWRVVQKLLEPIGAYAYIHQETWTVLKNGVQIFPNMKMQIINLGVAVDFKEQFLNWVGW